MMIHKTLQLTDDKDRFFVSRKEDNSGTISANVDYIFLQVVVIN